MNEDQVTFQRLTRDQMEKRLQEAIIDLHDEVKRVSLVIPNSPSHAYHYCYLYPSSSLNLTLTTS